MTAAKLPAPAAFQLYHALQEIGRRPACFEHVSAAELWTDEHVSTRMLALHLDGSVDVASRKTESIDRATAWIISRFALAEGKSVADLGCGPGLYASRLAASGAAVTGVDFSERSILYAREQARRRGLAIDYVCADYLEFASDRRFDLTTMIMCDYCALSRQQRRHLLGRVKSHLRPGGAFLLDVYSLAAFAERQELATCVANLDDGFWSAEPYFGFHCAFRYEAERVVLDKYTIVEERRTRVVHNWLQYFDRDALRTELEGEGLEVEEVLGGVTGAAYDPASSEFAVIARRTDRE